MDDICREAKLSPGAVYRYFPSKDAIIQALGERSAEQDLAFFASTPASTDPVADLARLAARYVRSIDAAETTTVSVQFWAEATRHPEVAGPVSGAIERAREGLVDLVRTAGLAERLDADAVAEALVALMTGRTLMRALGIAGPTEEYAAVVAAMVQALIDAGVAEQR
jgi:AcrR family transcriptional regulator